MLTVFLLLCLLLSFWGGFIYFGMGDRDSKRAKLIMTNCFIFMFIIFVICVIAEDIYLRGLSKSLLESIKSIMGE